MRFLSALTLTMAFAVAVSTTAWADGAPQTPAPTSSAPETSSPSTPIDDGYMGGCSGSKHTV